jgi:hypothetical protein
MSYDEHDAAMDAFYDDIREQFRPEIISEFTTDRLQSYFLLDPEVAKPAYLALEDALRLQDDSHRGCCEECFAKTYRTWVSSQHTYI